jgi:hypothetical protein
MGLRSSGLNIYEFNEIQVKIQIISEKNGIKVIIHMQNT